MTGAKAVRMASADAPPGFDRRRQLIGIAFDLIATKGFEGLRFRDVAAQAGINNATLAYHFPSKEALIQALVDNLMADLKGPEEETAASSAIEALRNLFEGVRRRVIKDPAFFIVITELALRARRDAAIAQIGRQRDDFFLRRISNILDRGVAEGLFRADLDTSVAALSIAVQLKGIAHHAAMRKRPAGEVSAIVSQLAVQAEHWFTCRTARR